MLLIKIVSLAFYPTKKKRLKTEEKDKYFDFMNFLLVSKNLKIIRKYDKSSKKYYVLFLRMMLFKKIFLFDQI